MTYYEILSDILSNVMLIAFLATLVAKLVEAVVGPLYELAYEAAHASEGAQKVWNHTKFFWALAIGLVLCIRAKIPFLGSVIPVPDAYIVCGILVGSGAGIVWDLLLDKPPVVWPEIADIDEEYDEGLPI